MEVFHQDIIRCHLKHCPVVIATKAEHSTGSQVYGNSVEAIVPYWEFSCSVALFLERHEQMSTHLRQGTNGRPKSSWGNQQVFLELLIGAEMNQRYLSHKKPPPPQVKLRA